MEYDKKVFYSDITRVDFEQKNNLQDLLNITPAVPVLEKIKENDTCIFEPRCDKYYVPKKKSRMKVRTVKEIRNQFEQDNYSFIIEDMEKQQSVLLTKIRNGSVTDDSTKKMAKTLLNADHPITRTAWQMLNNINPDKNANPTQFVLWNGRRIRVVGSKGGKNKFICNYDLGKNNKKEIKKICVEKAIKKKHGLLRDSLNIKFKPGPLRKKINLDDSHQRYHMSPVELVKLPKPALDIQSAYGTVLEPVMSNFLNKLRPENGTITKKWAEFAVSVLGTLEEKCVIQIDTNCCVTFDLNYKCGQDRVLMRRDNGNISKTSENATQEKNISQKKTNNMLEVQQILDKMLDSVEISLKQDCMYSIEEETPQTTPEPVCDYNVSNGKEKQKKKYGELGRLAVTVIQLPVKPEESHLKSCGKPYCNLGCICDSLNCAIKYKQHCGYFDCMFGCKCELSKYKNIELLENDCADLIPGLMKLDNEINANLAKEEQKFHQTVVVSGEKSILLKSRKRTSKSTIKYAEFCSNIRIKNEEEPKKILTVVGKKLNCANIQPWCMVHNLYKCFCKGRFTETSAFNAAITADSENSNAIDHDNFNTNQEIRNILRPRFRQSRESSEKSKSICAENNVLMDYENNYAPDNVCARTNEYAGRQYDDIYYKTTNYKILEMEKNDAKLHKKMMKIIKNTSLSSPKPSGPSPIILTDTCEGVSFENENNDGRSNQTNRKKSEINKNDIELDKNKPILIEHDAEPNTQYSSIIQLDSSNNSEDSKTSSNELNIPFEISGDIYKPIKGNLITQEFLTPWIAKSYKTYKEQLTNGKSILERPKRGRIILHLWECLLSRYRNRRNIFMTTIKRPFRIYIATETWKPFFKDCINIDAIRYVDLHKYPCLVKKLLTNASNKDYFCILGGWDDCWEIIGSVKKNESVTDGRQNNSDLSNTESLSQDSDFAQDAWNDKEPNKMANSSDIDFKKRNRERSKWFLIKLENDFTEIYCHKKGFYVEREKILHAIDLARITHKTVVINKQTGTEITNIPFGIYALPDTNDYCAVVGPYDIDESLGLEIVKAKMFLNQKCTKGYWISTNKVDNIKVLDDPLSFLPSKTAQNVLRSELAVNADKSLNDDDFDNAQPSTSQDNEKSTKIVQNQFGFNIIEKKIPKMVKPIKIRRTNGFYHLTSKNNIVKKILPDTAERSHLNVEKFKNDRKFDIANNSQTINLREVRTTSAFEAESTQIKIASVYSANDNTTEKDKTIEKDKKTGMFILKPEEINKKVSDYNYQLKYSDVEHAMDEMSMDIDKFLSPSGESHVSDNSVLIVSSDDENVDDEAIRTEKWTDVCIQSSIKNLGWIRARRNEENLLSVNFPGFKLTDLYNENEAFNKINRVLSTKIKIQKNAKIKWQVLSLPQARKCLKSARLNLKNMTNNNIITEKGILKSIRKVKNIRMNEASVRATRRNINRKSVILNTNFIEGLEKTSRLLEDQSLLLWNETESKQTEIIEKLNVPEEQKSEMSKTIHSLLKMNNDLVDD